MTTLALLPGGQASEVLREALGEDPAQMAGVADLIRDEVTARGACPRAATIRRVCRFVSPAVALDEAVVEDVCDRLERDGDLVLAVGGVLYSTPLRAVDLGQGVLRFASSLSTRRLAAQVVGIWTVTGTSRTCQVADADQARAAIVAAGGIVITPSAWACLDRTPRADQDWLAALDRRLTAEPETPASLERDESLVWAGCAVADGQIRWQAKGPEHATRLWRVRNRWGHWHYAWTQQGTPSVAPFVSLRPDEGIRTVFALARALGEPLVASISRQVQEAVLSVSQWLPVAEYRFLAVSASRSVVDRNGSRWSLPNDRVAQVVEVLGDRLGLVFREETH